MFKQKLKSIGFWCHNPFLTDILFFTTIYNNCCPLIYLSTLIAYIANNMDPDQTAPLGAVWSWFIVFAYMVKFQSVI